MSLRKKLVRLAYDQPHLRPVLLPLLKEGSAADPKAVLKIFADAEKGLTAVRAGLKLLHDKFSKKTKLWYQLEPAPALKLLGSLRKETKDLSKDLVDLRGVFEGAALQKQGGAPSERGDTLTPRERERLRDQLAWRRHEEGRWIQPEDPAWVSGGALALFTGGVLAGLSILSGAALGAGFFLLSSIKKSRQKADIQTEMKNIEKVVVALDEALTSFDILFQSFPTKGFSQVAGLVKRLRQRTKRIQADSKALKAWARAPRSTPL